MKLKHITWEEVPEQFGTDKEQCQQILNVWNSGEIGDFTMTVEFYPGEILDGDIEKIKVAVEDFNNHFPASKIEFDGDTNMSIILDTMEKQLWGFFTTEADLTGAVRSLKTELDKGEDGYNCIRRVIVNPKPDQKFLCIECFAGSSVKRYLRGILKQAGLTPHLEKEMEFIDGGNEHDYMLTIKDESLKFFDEFEN